MSFPIASMRLVFSSSDYKYKTMKLNMQIIREKFFTNITLFNGALKQIEGKPYKELAFPTQYSLLQLVKLPLP